MQHTIYIRDELVLEAHSEGDSPHILLRREGEPGTVRIYLNEVRYLADAQRDQVHPVTGPVDVTSFPDPRPATAAHEWPAL